jgi:hypothetical protein
MAGPNNQFQAMARQAAKRIEGSRELAEQLSLLPDEAQGAQGEGVKRSRGAGKAVNQMRDWLAARGYRAPEDVLAEMAGLASREDAILTAMAQAERVLTWAQQDAGKVKGAPDAPTMAKRLDVFMQLYTIQLRAADALMPYGAPKATPDVTQNVVTQIVMPGASAPAQPVRGGDMARDVTPQVRRIGPPPMPHQTQQNQSVSAAQSGHSDDAERTEEASD